MKSSKNLTSSYHHKSVLLDECIENLNIKEQGIYVDATIGGAGHSIEIVKKLKGGKLIGIDQDAFALNYASNRLEDYKDKVVLIRANFENIKYVLQDIGITKVNGILADLGVSSFQLDDTSRGFSYMRDARLDMRMDDTSSKTAYDIVNYYDKKDLTYIFSKYGEEKFSANIAKNIVISREEKPIETTLELVSIIDKSIPKKFKMKGSHPAKKVFQAIRIELNRELEVLTNALDDMVDLLEDDGRLCIITFHSLEDRIVKHFMKKCEQPCTCPPEAIMCVCGKKPLGKVVTRKPILPTEEEMEVNSRSKSAKLRVFERRYL